jgi:hypothetical protein
MPRRTETVVIPNDQGRDSGKVFIVTEMDAFQAETFALKVLFALGKAGLLKDLKVADAAAMAELAQVGLDAALTRLDAADLKPLLDLMLPCFAYQHAPGHPLMPVTDPGVIEEVGTLFTLRKAWGRLHLGFLKAGSILTTG